MTPSTCFAELCLLRVSGLEAEKEEEGEWREEQGEMEEQENEKEEEVKEVGENGKISPNLISFRAGDRVFQ